MLFRSVEKALEPVLPRGVKDGEIDEDLRQVLARRARARGDFAKAKASYEQTISLDASYAPAVLNLGILYDLYLWDGTHALECSSCGTVDNDCN